MEKTSKLLTIQEAADLLGLHPETLRRWDNEGKLLAIKTGSRGDRRYQMEDILKVKAKLYPVVYKDYQITPWSLGFEPFPDRFGSVASYIVKGKENVSGFAFAVAGMEFMAHPDLKEVNLQEKATEKIKNFIDAKAVVNGTEYLFE